MSQAGTGSLQGGSGDGGGTSTGKVGDEVEQRPSAAFWGRDCTSNCHLRPILPPATWAIPAGLTTASALLLGSDSSPQRQVRLTFRLARAAKSPPVGRRHLPVLSSYFHSPELHSGQCGQLSAHTEAPLPRFNFFSVLLLEILNWINPHRTFFLSCLLKNAIQEARPNT